MKIATKISDLMFVLTHVSFVLVVLYALLTGSMMIGATSIIYTILSVVLIVQLLSFVSAVSLRIVR